MLLLNNVSGTIINTSNKNELNEKDERHWSEPSTYAWKNTNQQCESTIVFLCLNQRVVDDL